MPSAPRCTRRPRHRAVKAVIRTEIAVHGGYVVLLISSPDDDAVVEIVMTADECRQYVNGLGEAILRLTRVGVMA
jgi:hypothetical protein